MLHGSTVRGERYGPTGDLVAFVETEAFTKRVTALELEEPLHKLQMQLLNDPEAGDVDPGTGGLRKIRMSDPARQKGKRGGSRVHYLWLERQRTVYFLFVYSKGEATTLSHSQKKRLREAVGQIKRAGIRK